MYNFHMSNIKYSYLVEQILKYWSSINFTWLLFYLFNKYLWTMTLPGLTMIYQIRLSPGLTNIYQIRLSPGLTCRTHWSATTSRKWTPLCNKGSLQKRNSAILFIYLFIFISGWKAPIVHQNVLHPLISNSIHQRSFIYYKPVREIDVRGRRAGMRCGPNQTFLDYYIYIIILCLY